jgi:hypothetical protein
MEVIWTEAHDRRTAEAKNAIANHDTTRALSEPPSDETCAGGRSDTDAAEA